MAGAWHLSAGEHVCWRASSHREYIDGHDRLAARAERDAGGLLLLGAGHGAPEAPCASIPQAREQMVRDRRGGRTPWVLASMSDLAGPDTAAADLVALELELAELAAQAETAVICAYQGISWEPEVLGAVTAVHSRVMGMAEPMSGFRLRATGEGYALEGSVGFESLPAFTAALHGALIRSPQLRLCCSRLEMIEAVAMRALLEVVIARPGCSLTLEHTGEAVRRAWELSGYDGAGVAVQVRP